MTKNVDPPRFLSMDTAPKDGTKFIGLMESGLVFRVCSQGYHTGMTKEEQEEFGHTGFHPTRTKQIWTYEESDSFMPCGFEIIGWMPMPKAPEKIEA